ncbi:hypothetical protein OR571_13195 [Psychrobacillus sp. NEAU-3TGS]|uniref:hypothetical protein n=1 Tax=Psychrobacillus sp. NEAU-3TGS TaxID=2995412 RepID=UPI00249988A7|nr:hypothetical protein [Psychrobacillus sp. NEAU-3TGS]MDI2588044.1 hypothetical protein [Psychrobacillus sp. NEAU-3TGS]
MPLEVRKVLVTAVPKGKTPSEHFTTLYEEIGKHLVNNASVLASDVTELTSDVKIEISLNPHEVITLQKTSNTIMIGE